MTTVVVYSWARDAASALIRSDGTVDWRSTRMSAGEDDHAAVAVAAALAEARDEELVGVTIGNGDASWALARGVPRAISVTDVPPLDDEAGDRRTPGRRRAAGRRRRRRRDRRLRGAPAGGCGARRGARLAGCARRDVGERWTSSGIRRGAAVRRPRRDRHAACRRSVLGVRAASAEPHAPGMKELLAARKRPIERRTRRGARARPAAGADDARHQAACTSRAPRCSPGLPPSRRAPWSQHCARRGWCDGRGRLRPDDGHRRGSDGGRRLQHVGPGDGCGGRSARAGRGRAPGDGPQPGPVVRARTAGVPAEAYASATLALWSPRRLRRGSLRPARLRPTARCWAPVAAATGAGARCPACTGRHRARRTSTWSSNGSAVGGAVVADRSRSTAPLAAHDRSDDRTPRIRVPPRDRAGRALTLSSRSGCRRARASAAPASRTGRGDEGRRGRTRSARPGRHGADHRTRRGPRRRGGLLDADRRRPRLARQEPLHRPVGSDGRAPALPHRGHLGRPAAPRGRPWREGRGSGRPWTRTLRSSAARTTASRATCTRWSPP